MSGDIVTLDLQVRF